MRFIKYFIAFLFVFTACKTKKTMINNTIIAKDYSSKKVAKKHVSANFSKKSLEAKYRADFDNGKLKQNISVNLKMIKDNVILLKGTKFITVFKLKITPEGVGFYSPINKTYFQGDFSMLKEILGVDIDFFQLQNLFLGQSLLDVTNEKQEVFIENNAYVLSPKVQDSLFDIFFFINPGHFKLEKQTVLSANKKERLDVFYPSYSLFKDVVFPSKINVSAKNKGTVSQLNFTLKAVEFNTDFDTRFVIPNGYKKIKL